jgi:O-antigen/teichoic acid export membrane protein
MDAELVVDALPSVPPGPEPAGPKPLAGDLTGRERMVRNVLFSWGGFLATAVVAFVHPRVMDRCLGQEAVGIWDFGWSLVAYFALAQFGVGSAITRYVALYRASGDVTGLRRVVSSVNCINWAAAAVATVLTAVFTWLAPSMLSAGAASHARDARWVVALVGATVISEIGFAVFPGVMGGCHRFDLNNALTAGFEIATWLTAIASLLLGGGLVTVALICFLFEVGTEAARVFYAYRVCPEISIRLRYANFGQARSLLSFGLKSQLGSLSSLMILQSNKLFVGTSLGPSMLAVFSRPLTLLKVVDTFASRLGSILSPAASSLQARGQKDEVKKLVEDSTRAGLALVFPMVLTLAVLGDPIMVLWMGSRYLPGLTVIVLAAGMFLSLALRPVQSVLMGLNLHGRTSLAQFVGAVLSFGLGWLNAHVLGWGLTGAALAIAVPTFLVSGVYVIAYAGRSVELPIGQYLRHSFVPPLACGLPLVLVLMAARVLFSGTPALAVGIGVFVGGLVLAPLYWRFLLTPPMRLQARGAAERAFLALRRMPFLRQRVA